MAGTQQGKSQRRRNELRRRRCREAKDRSSGGGTESRGLAEILPVSAGPAKTQRRLSSLVTSITTMATLPAMRQLGCLRSLARTQDAILPQTRRWISTTYSQRPERVPLPPNLPEQFRSQLPSRLQPENGIFPEIFVSGFEGVY